MTKPLEFSEVYKILNAIKEGDNSKKDLLLSILGNYKKGENAESFLHDLGQLFLSIGVEELFKYADSDNMKYIGQLSKEEWNILATKKNCDLPVYLANRMINFFKDQELSMKLSTKWSVSRKEIEKHVMPMSRYITEGIIDVLE